MLFLFFQFPDGAMVSPLQKNQASLCLLQWVMPCQECNTPCTLGATLGLQGITLHLK